MKIVPLGHALSLFLAITFTLCMLWGLTVPMHATMGNTQVNMHMHQGWAAFMPGFHWSIAGYVVQPEKPGLTSARHSHVHMQFAYFLRECRRPGDNALSCRSRRLVMTIAATSLVSAEVRSMTTGPVAADQTSLHPVFAVFV